MKIAQFIGTGAIIALSACAAPPPPPAIQGELILNKYGQPTDCVDGQFIPGAAYEEQCLPPEQCDPNLAAASNFDDCRPYRESEGDNGGTDPNQYP